MDDFSEPDDDPFACSDGNSDYEPTNNDNNLENKIIDDTDELVTEIDEVGVFNQECQGSYLEIFLTKLCSKKQITLQAESIPLDRSPAE